MLLAGLRSGVDGGRAVDGDAAREAAGAIAADRACQRAALLVRRGERGEREKRAWPIPHRARAESRVCCRLAVILLN